MFNKYTFLVGLFFSQVSAMAPDKIEVSEKDSVFTTRNVLIGGAVVGAGVAGATIFWGPAAVIVAAQTAGTAVAGQVTAAVSTVQVAAGSAVTAVGGVAQVIKDTFVKGVSSTDVGVTTKVYVGLAGLGSDKKASVPFNFSNLKPQSSPTFWDHLWSKGQSPSGLSCGNTVVTTGEVVTAIKTTKNVVGNIAQGIHYASSEADKQPLNDPKIPRPSIVEEAKREKELKSSKGYFNW